MCLYLRNGHNGGMIAISLVAVALSALSASAFRPPAFCVGRMTATWAKTTVVMYIGKDRSKDKLIARITELEEGHLNLQFKMMADKIDLLDHKIDNNTRELKTLSKDVSTLTIVLVVIACLCVAPQLSTILAFFK